MKLDELTRQMREELGVQDPDLDDDRTTQITLDLALGRPLGELTAEDQQFAVRVGEEIKAIRDAGLLLEIPFD